jgi:predicted dehydrogenase
MSVTRRSFLGTSAAVVAGTMVGGSAFGANDRVRICVAGVNGRGKTHIEEFSKVDGCEIAALVDPDSRVLSEIANKVKERYGKKPKTYRDIREALADDDIDVVTIATPNHWHSLMAIWAVQAGKDVYVEKPLSHNVWEGRQLVAATAQSDRMVMHGTQTRSAGGWIRDIKLIQDGFIGKLHLAKGFTYKTGNRYAIGNPADGEPPTRLDWNLWQGPAEERAFNRNYVHYNWHWFWHYGCGETGNQGVHQMDVCTWAINQGMPVKTFSAGGRFHWDDNAETPNTQMTTFVYADGTMMEFEVRNYGSYQEAGSLTTGNTFQCADGYYVQGQGFFDLKGKKIEVEVSAPESRENWVNFITAVRTRDKSYIHGTAEDGHISSAHCHLGNVAYRLGRSLEFDPETERFVDDEEANGLLTRDYRSEFKVPTLA